jgi:hypothetical protein
MSFGDAERCILVRELDEPRVIERVERRIVEVGRGL